MFRNDNIMWHDSLSKEVLFLPQEVRQHKYPKKEHDSYSTKHLKQPQIHCEASWEIGLA